MINLHNNGNRTGYGGWISLPAVRRNCRALEARSVRGRGFTSAVRRIRREAVSGRRRHRRWRHLPSDSRGVFKAKRRGLRLDGLDGCALKSGRIRWRSARSLPAVRRNCRAPEARSARGRGFTSAVRRIRRVPGAGRRPSGRGWCASVFLCVIVAASLCAGICSYVSLIVQV